MKREYTPPLAALAVLQGRKGLPCFGRYSLRARAAFGGSCYCREQVDCFFMGFAFFEGSALPAKKRNLSPSQGSRRLQRLLLLLGTGRLLFMGFAFYEGSALILPPERLSLSGLCNRSAPNFTLSSLFIQLQNAHKRLLGYFHRAQLAHPLLCLPLSKKRAFLQSAYSSNLSTLINASCGTSTVPNWRIRFLPSFCFSNSFFFRVISPP